MYHNNDMASCFYWHTATSHYGTIIIIYILKIPFVLQTVYLYKSNLDTLCCLFISFIDTLVVDQYSYEFMLLEECGTV